MTEKQKNFVAKTKRYFERVNDMNYCYIMNRAQRDSKFDTVIKEIAFPVTRNTNFRSQYGAIYNPKMHKTRVIFEEE